MIRIALAALAVLALAPCTPSSAYAQNRTARTIAPVSVRATPSPGGRVVGTLARGRVLQVSGCALRWCAVSTRDRSGYVPENVLSTAAPDTLRPQAVASRTRARPAQPSARSSVRAGDAGAPAGASAQCRDGSYSYSRSRRGTCSHHGGVAVWF